MGGFGAFTLDEPSDKEGVDEHRQCGEEYRFQDSVRQGTTLGRPVDAVVCNEYQRKQSKRADSDSDDSAALQAAKPCKPQQGGVNKGSTDTDNYRSHGQETTDLRHEHEECDARSAEGANPSERGERRLSCQVGLEGLRTRPVAAHSTPVCLPLTR